MPKHEFAPNPPPPEASDLIRLASPEEASAMQLTKSKEDLGVRALAQIDAESRAVLDTAGNTPQRAPSAQTTNLFEQGSFTPQQESTVSMSFTDQFGNRIEASEFTTSAVEPGAILADARKAAHQQEEEERWRKIEQRNAIIQTETFTVDGEEYKVKIIGSKDGEDTLRVIGDVDRYNEFLRISSEDRKVLDAAGNEGAPKAPDPEQLNKTIEAAQAAMDALVEKMGATDDIALARLYRLGSGSYNSLHSPLEDVKDRGFEIASNAKNDLMMMQGFSEQDIDAYREAAVNFRKATDDYLRLTR